MQQERSAFERLIASSPPILSSITDQLPTEAIFRLYQSSVFLRNLLKASPAIWRTLSWSLHQPAPLQPAIPPVSTGTPSRQPGSYPLDQLLMFVVLPFSSRLKSLALDNTTVSGATVFSTILDARRSTLEHVSVRGCKNVSLKYHVNPFLALKALHLDQPASMRSNYPQDVGLKSLYTYRCRHHRRRPYLPNSLTRKESDSEPTHELVLMCHKLGIWTDTAWCTTPGGRCFRRRGYVTMRVPQDPREVWVVFDRLWRSRNWLGPSPAAQGQPRPKKRKRDGRLWEEEEEGWNGEGLSVGSESKDMPVHERRSHRRFVESICCDHCSAKILERCEQCSVMMHCMGCRKTLCSSCAFDRPYTRNQTAPEDQRNQFWWAPGAAVSPCSMQDIDPTAIGAPDQAATLPQIKLRWCCSEPIFSGGGGITLGDGRPHDIDKLRAAPLPSTQGYDDPEFGSPDPEAQDTSWAPLCRSSTSGPAGRWASLQHMFRYNLNIAAGDEVDSVPRMLCCDCYNSEQWRIKCKACSIPLCLKHDVKERQRARICGYKDLSQEKQEFVARLKATKLFRTLWQQRKARKDLDDLRRANMLPRSEALRLLEEADLSLSTQALLDLDTAREPPHGFNNAFTQTFQEVTLSGPLPTRPVSFPLADSEPVARPQSPDSTGSSTGPASRASSPAPSARSVTSTPEQQKQPRYNDTVQHSQSLWKGCQAFYCPPMRTPPDSRRRCSAVMQQCSDCKIYVCDDCVSGLDQPCQCSACHIPEANTDPESSTLAFFCPNCRRDRILQNKCRKGSAGSTQHLAQPTEKENSVQRLNADQYQAQHSDLSSWDAPSGTSESPLMDEFHSGT